MRRFGKDPKRLITAELVPLAEYDERHRFPCFQRCLDEVLRLLYPDLEASPTPVNAEANAAPIRRQLWVDGNAVAMQRQPCETEHCRQPDPAQGCDMNATCNCHMRIRKINRRGLPEVAQRHFGVAQPGSDKPMHGAAQRAAVAAARLVVTEVLRPRLANELLWE